MGECSSNNGKPDAHPNSSQGAEERVADRGGVEGGDASDLRRDCFPGRLYLCLSWKRLNSI
jgi:hypothetical protein